MKPSELAELQRRIVDMATIWDLPDRSKKYAGIGSRQTPTELEPVIQRVAEICNERGYTLRSGAAEGADQMFEKWSARAEIFLPWKPFGKIHQISPGRTVHHGSSAEAFKIAENVHPTWHRLTDGGRKLHARNAHQILGVGLDNPVDFVVCWTPNGEEVGGTRTGIKIAQMHGIPVWNLANERDRAEWLAL